jgi:hypothetical protein
LFPLLLGKRLILYGRECFAHLLIILRSHVRIS